MSCYFVTWLMPNTALRGAESILRAPRRWVQPLGRGFI